MEANYILTISTLSDPRFKRLGFRNYSKYQIAIDRLGIELAEYASRANASTDTYSEALSLSEPSSSPTHDASTCARGLWSFVDSRVAELELISH